MTSPKRIAAAMGLTKAQTRAVLAANPELFVQTQPGRKGRGHSAVWALRAAS